MAEDWHENLKKYDNQTANDALSQFVIESKFYPSLHDLLEICEESEKKKREAKERRKHHEELKKLLA